MLHFFAKGIVGGVAHASSRERGRLTNAAVLGKTVALQGDRGWSLSGFILHPRLQADCHRVGEFALSRVLLLDDRRYPWLILVPRRAGIREIHELGDRDRSALLDESCRLGAFLLEAFDGEKLNLGALGNLVPQLHLHHIVRHRGDPAWPGPVWGHSPAEPYPAGELAKRLAVLRQGLDIAA